MKKYAFLEHPADIKIESFGKDLPELFINSALGMMDFLFVTENVVVTHQEKIVLDADNIEDLLISWLAEILYLSNVNKRAYLNYEIKILECNDDHCRIESVISSGKSLVKDEIKAVTYHDLQIEKTNENWEAMVVYDI